MKTLYLVRHAEAIPRDAGVNDFNRALVKSGKHDAQAMSRRLQKKGIRPDLLLASAAVRAMETAHIFAETFGYPLPNISLSEDIYDKDEQGLQEMLAGLEDMYATVMLFGHEPALSRLAKMFLPDFECVLRKSGVIGIAFKVARWQEISAETATLLLFDFPVRITPKVYKKARKTLKHEISATMDDILAQIHVSASKHVTKIIQKTSKRMAKELIKMLEAAKVEDLAGVKKGARVDHLALAADDRASSVPAVQPSVEVPAAEATVTPAPAAALAVEEDQKPRKQGQRAKKQKK